MSDVVKVVILAAGYGTRLQRDLLARLASPSPSPSLRESSSSSPSALARLLGVSKPLLPVQGTRPLVDLWIERLVAVGLGAEDIFVVANESSHAAFAEWARTSSGRLLEANIINDGTTSNEARLGAVADMALAVRAVLGMLEAPAAKPSFLFIGGDTLFFDTFCLACFLEEAGVQLAAKTYASPLAGETIVSQSGMRQEATRSTHACVAHRHHRISASLRKQHDDDQAEAEAGQAAAERKKERDENAVHHIISGQLQSKPLPRCLATYYHLDRDEETIKTGIVMLAEDDCASEGMCGHQMQREGECQLVCHHHHHHSHRESSNNDKASGGGGNGMQAIGVSSIGSCNNSTLEHGSDTSVGTIDARTKAKRIVGFLEKPAPSETTSRSACPCFYFLCPQSLCLLETFLEEKRTLPLSERDATGKFLGWLQSRHEVYATQISGRFDVGDLASYLETVAYFGGSAA